MKNKVMSTSLKSLLIIFWIITIIIPVLTMFGTMTSDDISRVFSSESFSRSLYNSIYTSAVSTIISVSLAFLLATCIVRSNIKAKWIFSTIMMLPMLIPSMSHGMGLIILLGRNGVLSEYLPKGFNIYGELGIITGSVMYSFPVAYLMISDILKYEDGSPYEAARVLGLSKISTFRVVTLPYMFKPVLNVVFAVFTMTITDYGVPLMVGGQCTTLSVMMYREVVGMLNFGEGSVIGTMLLVPAVFACVMDIITRDNTSQSVRRPFVVNKSLVRDSLSYVVCSVVCIITVVPIAVFVAVSFVTKYPIDMSFSIKNIETALNMNVMEYLTNSLIISALVSVVGTVVAVVCSYITSRTTSKLSKFLHMMSISSLAVPGIVLGLSYAMAFKESSIYGTFIILVLVNSMHFFSSPYLMMHNTFSKMNPNIESAGSTLGVSKLSIILNVLIPMSKSTIIEMMTYFFVNSMMTISAVSFLYTSTTKPVAITITQFEGQMQLECAAFVSLLILVVNLLAKGLTYLVKKERKLK